MVSRKQDTAPARASVRPFPVKWDLTDWDRITQAVEVLRAAYPVPVTPTDLIRTAVREFCARTLDPAA